MFVPLKLLHCRLALVLLLLWQPSVRPMSGCETLKYSFCRKHGYNINMTIVPNFFGHRSQKQAMDELNQMAPLINVQCSEDMALFLCSVFFPVCTMLGKIIPPCRPLCLSAKSGCERIMNKFGYSWPKKLDCRPFPKNQFQGEQVCIFQNKSTNSSPTVEPNRRTTSPTQLPSLKVRCKLCWESKDGVNKQCCRQGNKAAKMGIGECSLGSSRKRTKSYSRKQTRFVRRASKICSAKVSARMCYHACCKYKNRQLKPKKNRKRTRKIKSRRQPR